ncbi:malonate decarboxylase epsilon subunit [Streptomyces sp. WMMB 714]|uniref:acyltransferase domain-containing protein n=1 Tax=Streptomyces sp. WMMB 714 TaxID=1286822 RepID=UPI000823F527|nr:acyltransferase domain-containing protein [Streptomyces sp. WMMB 714]SCK38939.1 malonate decarboxylase epsilon subunit [Streptomyces sp. WMMB 714]
MSIAFLFPGRGSQRPGMLHRLPDTAASATVLAEADWALRRLASKAGSDAAGAGLPARAAGREAAGREYADGIAELDTAEALEKSPVACHVALLVAGVAGARAMAEDEGVVPALVAGEDVGAYAAAVIAEVLTLEEALRAVRLRGELLERADEPEGDVAIRLAQHLATVKRRPQKVPYVSGVHGRSLRGDTNAVFDELARSVARPVQWEKAAEALAGEGAVCCVELPPGRALTSRTAAAVPGMRAVSVEEHGLADAAESARSASPGASAGDRAGGGGGNGAGGNGAGAAADRGGAGDAGGAADVHGERSADRAGGGEDPWGGGPSGEGRGEDPWGGYKGLA